MFSQNQVHEDDDMDLVDVNLEDSVDDDDRDEDEINAAMGYFNNGNVGENCGGDDGGNDVDHDYDDFGSDDGSGEYKSPLISPVKFPVKSPVKSSISTIGMGNRNDRSPQRHHPNSHNINSNYHLAQKANHPSSSSSSWVRSLTGFAMSSAITTITTTASVAVAVTAFAITGVLGTVVGELYQN